MKYADTSTAADFPAGISRLAISPTATGLRLGTRNRNCWSTDSCVKSVAVTVTTLVPGDTAVTVNVLPETETVAMPASEEAAE